MSWRNSPRRSARRATSRRRPVRSSSAGLAPISRARPDAPTPLTGPDRVVRTDPKGGPPRIPQRHGGRPPACRQSGIKRRVRRRRSAVVSSRDEMPLRSRLDSWAAPLRRWLGRFLNASAFIETDAAAVSLPVFVWLRDQRESHRATEPATGSCAIGAIP